MSELFTATVYLLCGLASATCAALLTRRYLQTRGRLLLWSAICFALLASNNMLVIVDLLILSNIDLRLPRLLLALAAGSMLVFGFIWDEED